MDIPAFEASLRTDGFTEIERKTFAPTPANGEHGHHFTIRGLVLDGEFTVICGNDVVTYRSGEIFAVPEGCLHCEEIGPAGASVVIGRKF